MKQVIESMWVVLILIAQGRLAEYRKELQSGLIEQDRRTVEQNHLELLKAVSKLALSLRHMKGGDEA